MNKKQIRFRQSKEAMILDILLLPIGFLFSLIMQGIPGTIEETKRLPQTYSRGWKDFRRYFGKN